MNKFWELLEKSVIVSGALTLMFGGAACYMFVMGIEIPELLAFILTSIVSFFFGSKVTAAAYKAQARKAR